MFLLVHSIIALYLFSMSPCQFQISRAVNWFLWSTVCCCCFCCMFVCFLRKEICHLWLIQTFFLLCIECNGEVPFRTEFPKVSSSLHNIKWWDSLFIPFYSEKLLWWKWSKVLVYAYSHIVKSHIIITLLFQSKSSRFSFKPMPYLVSGFWTPEWAVLGVFYFMEWDFSSLIKNIVYFHIINATTTPVYLANMLLLW